MDPYANKPPQNPNLPEVPPVIPQPNNPTVPQPDVVSPAPAPQVDPLSPITPGAQQQPTVGNPTMSPATSPAPVAPVAPVTPVAGFGQATPTPGSFAQNPVIGSGTGAPFTPPKKKVSVGAIIGIIGGIVVLIGSILAVVLLVLPGGKISESDLVSENIDNTTILRPKQWESISVGDISGFGDKKAKDGKSTAVVLVGKDNYIQSGIKEATETQRNGFVDAVVKNTSKSSAEEYLKKTGECTSISDVKIEKANTNPANAVGVLTIKGTCKRDNVDFRILYYGLLGNDGYARSYAIIATADLWEKNEAVFQKMLEGVDQS